MNAKKWLRDNPPPTPDQLPDELDPVVEKVGELAQQVGSLEAKTALREEQERPSPAEAAERMGLPRDFVGAEESVWKRLSPFHRERWPEVGRFDERAAQLEMRQAEVSAEMRELHERIQRAPDHDAETLARWELRDRDGDRPQPTLPDLEHRMKELQAEQEGLVRATDEVLGQKADYVAKHRGQLQRQAKDSVDETARRYLELVDELQHVREELRSRRRDEVWASLYPRGEAMAEPPDTLAGGRRKPLQQAGFTGPVAPDRLFDTLRADVEWLREACTTEQAAAIAGVDPRHKPGTVWTDDPEEKRKRGERMAQWAASR